MRYFLTAMAIGLSLPAAASEAQSCHETVLQFDETVSEYNQLQFMFMRELSLSEACRITLMMALKTSYQVEIATRGDQDKCPSAPPWSEILRIVTAAKAEKIDYIRRFCNIKASKE